MNYVLCCRGFSDDGLSVVEVLEGLALFLVEVHVEDVVARRNGLNVVVQGHLAHQTLAVLGVEQDEDGGADSDPDAEVGLPCLQENFLLGLLAHVLDEEAGRDVVALSDLGRVRWTLLYSGVAEEVGSSRTFADELCQVLDSAGRFPEAVFGVEVQEAVEVQELAAGVLFGAMAL